MHDQINSTILPTGATVLTEHMPGLRSITIGIWVKRGSRHEAAKVNGISHFIEHTVFKGTRRRSALDIAIESDRLGGHLDAYTSHEVTGFALKVADTALAPAFDLLIDMVLDPRFDENDLRLEQKVIIEEMKMVEDTPEEYLAELFNSAYFPDHPLGRPIEGTEETVSAFDGMVTRKWHHLAYDPHNLIIAAAGNINHSQVVALVEKATTFRPNSSADSSVISNGLAADAHAALESIDEKPQPAAPILVMRKKGLEQAHLILASPWPDSRNDDRYAASLLASVIGGGTSSRLWQSIREERGLAYSVGAATSTFMDIGVFQVYAGTSPKQIDAVIDLTLLELRRVVEKAVSADEMRLVKDQAISSILLGLESSSARAGSLARQEIVHRRRISPEEVIERLELVTPEEMQRIARHNFQTEKIALAVIGELNGFKAERSRLEI
ncbi:MAG: M16 family metallopeptidase [Pyrinomonadaceae bacterium]